MGGGAQRNVTWRQRPRAHDNARARDRGQGYVPPRKMASSWITDCSSRPACSLHMAINSRIVSTISPDSSDSKVSTSLGCHAVRKNKKKKKDIRQLRGKRWLWQERTVIETVKSTLPTRMASGPQPSWISSMETSYSAFLAPTMHHTQPFPPIYPAGGILTGLARKSTLPQHS